MLNVHIPVAQAESPAQGLFDPKRSFLAVSKGESTSRALQNATTRKKIDRNFINLLSAISSAY